jgi:hypothetical protein
MSLPSLGLERALLEETNRDDFLRILTVDSLSASRTVPFTAIVVLLRSHQSARQAFVAKDVACFSLSV